MKQHVLFSSDLDTIEQWKTRDPKIEHIFYDSDKLMQYIQKHPESVVIVDYDSVAQDFNKLIASDRVPSFSIVLERSPVIQTGKFLVSHGIKAYGNAAMLKKHYDSMLRTVEEGDIWTYPELTAILTKKKKKELSLSESAMELIRSRLSQKEQDVLFLILEGLTNEAIANKMDISTRTVKAHISSIFEKLHVNDRLSLALLLLQK